jgi:hypothetical protein
MAKEEPLEPPILRNGFPFSVRWVASLGGAALTAFWVFDTTAGAQQRMAWLMERARPACIESGVNREELHRLAARELDAGLGKRSALEAVVAMCHARRAAQASRAEERETP